MDKFLNIGPYILWDVDVARICSDTFLSLMCLAVVDLIYARNKAGRYFFLHVIANAAISALVFPETLWMLYDPLGALAEMETSTLPFSIVLAIHVYHMCAPGFTLYYVDWLHHILMIVIGLPPLIFAKYGPLMNVNFLIICGIPGGIDYLMLYLVKQGQMKSLTEKSYNTVLNVWLRAPCLISVVILSFIQTHLLSGKLSMVVIILRILCMTLNWWNAQYFQERVVANYYVTDYKIREARKTGDKSVYKLADENALRKPALKDLPEEHPLPSAPMLHRTANFDTLAKAWEFVRAGS
eukprot:m.335852 g.335852  ORF g.335852 m.335852 type:complete len:296 (-) comp17695_c0_seq1:56-943(-)